MPVGVFGFNENLKQYSVKIKMTNYKIQIKQWQIFYWSTDLYNVVIIYMNLIPNFTFLSTLKSLFFQFTLSLDLCVVLAHFGSSHMSPPCQRDFKYTNSFHFYTKRCLFENEIFFWFECEKIPLLKGQGILCISSID